MADPAMHGSAWPIRRACLERTGRYSATGRMPSAMPHEKPPTKNAEPDASGTGKSSTARSEGPQRPAYSLSTTCSSFSAAAISLYTSMYLHVDALGTRAQASARMHRVFMHWLAVKTPNALHSCVLITVGVEAESSPQVFVHMADHHASVFVHMADHHASVPCPPAAGRAQAALAALLHLLHW
jgi:hypothetical protein